MIIYLAGDIYGKINQFYDNISRLEKKTRLSPEWVLQTGNFGIYPDNLRLDRQMRRYGEVDFAELYFKQTSLPYPTLFVAGKYEDHRWLDLKYSKGEMEILQNLHWLVNGYKTFIGDNTEQASICGLGKVFSENSYFYNRKDKVSRSHYNQNEVEKACTQGPTDILLTHQAGHGERIGQFLSVSQGIQKIIFAIRPQVHIHAGYGTSQVYTNKQGILTYSLAPNELRIINWDSKTHTISHIY